MWVFLTVPLRFSKVVTLSWESPPGTPHHFTLKYSYFLSLLRNCGLHSKAWRKNHYGPLFKEFVKISNSLAKFPH